MNYNKIRKEIDEKFSSDIEFCKKIGLPKSTFDRIFTKKSTRVHTLELISDGLGLSPAYWWQEEEQGLNMAKESSMQYGGYIPRSVYLDMVSKWNEDRESKKKLEDQLTEVLKLLCTEKNKKAC
jgi:hypothetical protein